MDENIAEQKERVKNDANNHKRPTTSVHAEGRMKERTRNECRYLSG